MIDDVKELLGLAGRIKAAIKGAGEVETLMRERIEEYTSILERLQNMPGDTFSNEAKTLGGLFRQVEELQSEHTAGVDEKSMVVKVCKTTYRGCLHTSIEKRLDDIDRGVMR